MQAPAMRRFGCSAGRAVIAAAGARGWWRIGPDDALVAWAAAARAAALRVLPPPGPGWRHGGTWCPGVDLLPNDACGAVPGGPPLPDLAPLPGPRPPLHPAQISAVRPGYPGRDPGETDAAHAFRRRRDAAHLDGLLPVGPARRRMIREPHAWILGIAINDAEPAAAPLVVWEGSHRLLRAALARVLAPHPPASWGEVDVTAAYADARRQVFDRCPRVALPMRPGEAVLLDRHLLHGIAPWAPDATAPAEGRLSAYFRPLLPDVAAWMRDG
jgi:hypothetical protein